MLFKAKLWAEAAEWVAKLNINEETNTESATHTALVVVKQKNLL